MATGVRFTSGALNLKFTILLGAVLFIWTGTFLLLIPCQPSHLTESRIKPGWIWRNLPSLTDIQLNCPVSQDPEWWQHIKAEIFRRDILTSLILEITPRHHSSVGAPSPVARGVCHPAKLPPSWQQAFRCSCPGAASRTCPYLPPARGGHSSQWRELNTDFQSCWTGTWGEHAAQKSPGVRVLHVLWKHLKSVAEVNNFLCKKL